MEVSKTENIKLHLLQSYELLLYYTLFYVAGFSLISNKSSMTKIYC